MKLKFFQQNSFQEKFCNYRILIFLSFCFVHYPSAAFAQTAHANKSSDHDVAPKPYRNDWLSKPPSNNFCTPAPASLIDPKILLALRARDLKLDAKAAEIDKKQATVAAAEHVLSVQLVALKVVKAKLLELNVKREAKTNGDLHNIAQMYEVMQARDAGNIFDKLDNKLAAELLKQMDVRHSSAILAAMTTKQSILATEELAGIRSAADASNPDFSQNSSGSGGP